MYWEAISVYWWALGGVCKGIYGYWGAWDALGGDLWVLGSTGRLLGGDLWALGGTGTGFMGPGRFLGSAQGATGRNWALLGCHLGHRRVPGELAFVGGCLGVNPKSYGAWHHRGWVLRRAPVPPPAPAERALCDRLLAADPRNCERILGHTGGGPGGL